jgi:hypothetical protein
MESIFVQRYNARESAEQWERACDYDMSEMRMCMRKRNNFQPRLDQSQRSESELWCYR